MKLEPDLEPAPFTKRVSHPPFARGGYNSEEWVFDDEDDDDLPAEQDELGEEQDARHYYANMPDDGIRSLEVSHCCACCSYSLDSLGSLQKRCQNFNVADLQVATKVLETGKGWLTSQRAI